VTEGGKKAPVEGVTSTLTQVIAKVLLVPTLMIAVATLFKGYAQTGDGFSAGVIAALAIVLQYLAFGREVVERYLPVQGLGTLSWLGLLLALGVAAVGLFRGDALFTHYPAPGAEVIHIGTVEVITAVLFDVGIFLLVFGYAVGAVRIIAGVIQRQESGEPEEEAVYHDTEERLARREERA
jgi:multisubunit Na+/H+ antiporter MnhB subunit